jgi:hypothetical protein
MDADLAEARHLAEAEVAVVDPIVAVSHVGCIIMKESTLFVFGHT